MGVQLPPPGTILNIVFSMSYSDYGRLWRSITRRWGTNMGTVPISLILNELFDPYRFSIRLD